MIAGYDVICFDFEIKANQRSREIELSETDKQRAWRLDVKPGIQGPDAVWNEVEEKQQTLVENLYFLRPYPNDFHQLR